MVGSPLTSAHRLLKDSVVDHWSVHWKSMEDCFRDICAFGEGYKRTKGYGRAKFYAQGASKINEVKSTKDPGLCFRCGRHHFHNRCTEHINKNLMRDPRAHHIQHKTADELIIHKDSKTIETKTVLSYRNLIISSMQQIMSSNDKSFIINTIKHIPGENKMKKK